jgi:hypothetical protein
LETGVLVLQLHCKFSCIVGDRSFSAAAALINLIDTYIFNEEGQKDKQLIYKAPHR